MQINWRKKIKNEKWLKEDIMKSENKERINLQSLTHKSEMKKKDPNSNKDEEYPDYSELDIN